MQNKLHYKFIFIQQLIVEIGNDLSDSFLFSS